MNCPYCKTEMITGYVALAGNMNSRLIFMQEKPTSKWRYNVPIVNLLSAKWKLKDNLGEGYLCNSCNAVCFKSYKEE